MEHHGFIEHREFIEHYKTCYELSDYYVQVVEGPEPLRWGWLSHPKGKQESGASSF